MSLYGNFTLKEWLTLHCVTKDIDDLFRKALKDNDEPMAVLALVELVKRGNVDLIADGICDAVQAGYLADGSHFSGVIISALCHYGSRDSLLKRLTEEIALSGGVWPERFKKRPLRE